MNKFLNDSKNEYMNQFFKTPSYSRNKWRKFGEKKTMIEMQYVTAIFLMLISNEVQEPSSLNKTPEKVW